MPWESYFNIVRGNLLAIGSKKLLAPDLTRSILAIRNKKVDLKGILLFTSSPTALFQELRTKAQLRTSQRQKTPNAEELESSHFPLQQARLVARFCCMFACHFS